MRIAFYKSLCLTAIIFCSQAWAQEVRGIALAHLHARTAGYGSDACRTELDKITAVGANWIAINDFAYMNRVDEPGVIFNRDGTLSRAALVGVVNDAKERGLAVLVKPHIWSRQFWNGSKWHGDIRMTSEAEWDKWFADYTKYLLYNAGIAAETGADAFCVGVELVGTTDQEARWRKLVADVRVVYRGPIVYSANFDEWEKIKWWDAVDVIGIDAYFPLSTEVKPTDDQIRAGWERVYARIVPFARALNRRVCFTEIGYTRSSRAAVEPWSYEVADEDQALQERLYRIAIEEVVKHDTVVGLFVWKWFSGADYVRHERSDPFAVQGAPPVLDLLKEKWKGK